MRRLLLVLVVVAAMLLPATSASAALTGELARFGNCPLNNPAVNTCIYAETVSGYITTGNKTVPVKNPVILQGGLQFNGNYSETLSFYPPQSGSTLSKTPQPVPGGLLGVTAPSWWPSFLRNLFNETINNGFTGVTATMELAAPPSAVKLNVLSVLTGQGTALALPVKVKLSNPFLGSNCYIGSNSQPIQLNLITGTTSPPPPNQPISGTLGEQGGLENGRLLYMKGQRLVDNSFATPGANGCGGLFSFLVDPFVESIVGVPSPSGTNAAVLEGSTFLAEAELIRENL